jgi:hypothetical protein
MAELGALREEALRLLRRHYAAGHLRLPTLEHRLELALRARTPEDLSAVTWDLPAVRAGVWQALKAEVSGLPAHRPCSRMSFKTVPEVVLELDEGPRTWRIGRDPSCDVVLRDPAVSRHHALLSLRGGRCTVRDLGSTNGLLLNGHRIETATLAAGDLLSFGNAVHAIAR